MRSTSSAAGVITLVLAMATLSGCLCPDMHRQQRNDLAMKAAPEAEDDLRPWRDIKVMCAEHRKLSQVKTREERQAMMDPDMKELTPDMMQDHMWAIDDLCRRRATADVAR